MDRRDFALSALLGGAAAILPSIGQAAASGAYRNVIFTQADPGHWAAVEAIHVPLVTVSGGKLTIKTPHPMSESHYIVSHTVVLADGRFLGRKTFSWKDQPVSEHVLPAGYQGPVIVTSTCNLHDFWVKTITV